MSHAETELQCPHCGTRLTAMELPDNTGWDTPYHWVCFSDECSYYKEGWDWMWASYRVKASYRYRIMDPETGHASPLPVWSETAMRDRVVTE